jgi:hypothetical protein
MTTLDPRGGPVRVGSVTLRTPGLVGEANVRPPGTEQTRGPEFPIDDLETALRNAGVASQQTIELSAMSKAAVEGTTRSPSEPAIELEVPDPGPDQGQLVFYRDASGLTTWHLSRSTRGSANRTYLIRRYAAAPRRESGARGQVAAIGKAILKVLVFPLIDPVIGRIADDFVERWEKKNRPHRIRTFTPANYRDAEAPPLEAGDWDTLSKGRALLMVHGTFSRTGAAFGDLPPEYVQRIFQMYEGRVFSFDHPTLSVDPEQNAEQFVRSVPAEATLELDIVCHSRGGLVSRVLAEKPSQLPVGSGNLSVRKVIFVATPNAGTLLADTRRVGDFIDTYTNLLNLLPSTGVTDVFEAIIAVLKQVAVATVKGLPGLQSMLPEGDFLQGMNRGQKDRKEYFALTSNFEPTDPGLKAFAEDRLLDAVFDAAENDLVVPTAGVYERNGSGFFPITDRQVFSADAGIAHTGFFANAAAREKILDWLSG